MTRNPSRLRTADVPGLLKAGMRVFVQGLASEPAPFREALAQHGGARIGIHVVGAMVPGINGFDYASLHSEGEFTGMFPMSLRGGPTARRRTHQLPLHYSQAWRWFSEQRFDVVVLHVSPPDKDGACSFGVNADFAEAAMKNASMLIGYVNPCMPRSNGPGVAWDAFDSVVEIDRPLPLFTTEEPDPVTDRIASRVASLIGDNDCLQLGIGKVPSTVLAHLRGHRGLALHSGLVTDGMVDLMNAGALRGIGVGGQIPVVTNALVGTARLYAAAADKRIALRNVAHTHSPVTLAKIEQFVSINSAIEVDLLGQVNSETVAGRMVSSVGGAVDFIRGAALSRGGRAIIALPSTTSAGQSRIVARLQHGAPVTIARSDAPIVVTEHGVADLRGCNVDERRRRLLTLVDPGCMEEVAARDAAIEVG